MFTSFRRETSVFFLDPLSTQKLSPMREKKINLILSPSLYWVKKLKLPLQNVREVKKLLPSIFEDSLPEGNYSYHAYKQDEEFFLFAYEDKKIIDLMSQNGVSYADISSVHFAQSEFKEMEIAFCVNQKQCMYLKDEIIILAPSAWISEKKQLNLQNIKLSNHTIKLQQFGHIVDKSSLYKIGVILGFLALILLVEIFISIAKKDEIIQAKENIFAQYKLQETMLQNRSTLQKYALINKNQTNLREYLALFLNLKLQKEQIISLLEYKNNLLIITIDGVKKASSSLITKALDAKKLQYKTSFKDENMRVEIKI